MMLCKSFPIMFLAFAFLCKVMCHPQCLDGKPPFKSSRALQFCAEYKDYGCCTFDMEQTIQKRYQELFRSVTNTSCQAYLKELVCQECSPYAAHLYSFEETGFISKVPGLCGKYCNNFYKTCGTQVLALFSNDPPYRSALQTATAFCAHVDIADKDYCYPELKTNPVLEGKFINSQTNRPDCMCLQKVADGLGIVTIVEKSPMNDGYLYIGEQIGNIYVYDAAGRKLKEPFLNLTSTVFITKSKGDERGLLSMTFHPDFDRNRLFYLLFVIKNAKGEVVRISEWTANNHQSANQNSEKVLLDIPQPYRNHNGGQLLFGKDGYLYIIIGDGGGAGDPLNHAQNKSSILGKALRINVLPGTGRYTIPADNPFVNSKVPEMYAYGLRNPWRCSEDPGDYKTGNGKGRLFCADVGQSKFEEIDIIVKGGNYGWGYKEGFDCFKSPNRTSFCGKLEAEELPIHAYNHSVGKSVTGGYVYRGCDYAPYNGHYFYGDFVSGKIFTLSEETNSKWKNKEVFMCASNICTGNWMSTYGKGITTFGVSSHGDILMASSSDMLPFSNASSVYKLIMQPYGRSDPLGCKSAQQQSMTTPKMVPTTQNRNIIG